MAQAVALLVYPLLTRLYTTGQFGLFNIFLSLGGILVLFATLQYEYSIVLPREERQARWCLHAGVASTLVVVVCCIAMLPFRRSIALLLGAGGLEDYLWMLPVYVCGMALWQLTRYWLLRHRRVDLLSTNQVSQAVISAGGKVAGGYGGLAGGLIAASTAAPLLAWAITLLRTPAALLRTLLRLEHRGTRAAACRYRNFPFFTLPKALLESLSSNLPLLLMAPLFGLDAVGFVGMAMTLAMRPINIVGSSLNQVFYQRAATEVQQHRPVWGLCQRYLLWAFAVAVPVFVALYVWLPAICAWLLGDQWRESGEYIRVMLPWLLLVLMNHPVNFLPDLFGRQRGLFVFTAVRITLQAAALGLGFVLRSPHQTLLLYALAAAVVLVAQLLWFRHLALLHDRTL